jgi:P27 family predicted phage terminase small subunit
MWLSVSRAAVWLAPSDLPTLTLLCELADRRAEFLAILDSAGPVLVNPSGRVVANPIVGMLSTLERQMIDISATLGLTPADRTRLGVAEVRAETAFEAMLSKRAQREMPESE